MGTMISLFDYSGVMVKPWVEAGHDAICVDIKHDKSEETTRRDDGGGVMEFIKGDLMHPLYLHDWGMEPSDVVFVSAFPLCTHLAVSGARWFKGKGLRKLAESINMFATAAEFCEASGAPYMIENPVSTISTYWRKPDYIFHPWEYSGYCQNDNYTKKTCLWTGGGFKMPEKYIDESLGTPDNRIHREPPGPNREINRSITPEGFARAVYQANSIGVRKGVEWECVNCGETKPIEEMIDDECKDCMRRMRRANMPKML